MTESPQGADEGLPSLVEALGRRAAPHLMRARWLFRSATGSEDDRLKAEQEFGAVLARTYLQAMPGRMSPLNQRFLDQLGRKLTVRLSNRKRHIRLIGSTEAEIEAFAFPGGYIFISQGLLQSCRLNEDEVAFVAAHEIGHVVKGHAVKRMMSSTLLRAIARSRLSRTPLTRTVAGLAESLMANSYSRDQERAADLFGMRLTLAAGFNPRGAVALFERLMQANPQEIPTYFSSHPPLAERRDIAEEAAAALEKKPKP